MAAFSQPRLTVWDASRLVSGVEIVKGEGKAMAQFKLVLAAMAGAVAASAILVSTGFASRQVVTPRHEQIAAAKILNFCDVFLRFEYPPVLPIPPSDPKQTGLVELALGALRAEHQQVADAVRVGAPLVVARLAPAFHAEHQL
jgi:hypothetical protein